MTKSIFCKKVALLIFLFFLIDLLLSFLLINGLNRYYGFNNQNEILVNGSSMAASGFNKETIERLTGKEVASYCQNGASVEDRKAMIEYYFSNQTDSKNTVIYEVNPLLLSQQLTAENVYTRFFPFMDEKSMDAYIKKNTDKLDYLIHKIIRTSRFDSGLIISILRDYFGKNENIKTNQIDNNAIKKLEEQRGKKQVIINTDQKSVFESTMDLLSDQKSQIILVMMPMYQAKLQSFDSVGYLALSKYYENYANEKPNVKYIDMNESDIVKSKYYFSDPLHFNKYGQKKLSEMISSIILEDK